MRQIASGTILNPMEPSPPAPPDPVPEYLTRQEAADLLRVDVQTIDRLARSGRLMRYRVDTGSPRSRTLFRTDEVRGLVKAEPPHTDPRTAEQ